MSFQIIIRATPAEFTNSNLILLENQIGIEIDVRNNENTVPPKAKVGDGVTRWNDLEYWNTGGSVQYGDNGGTENVVQVPDADGLLRDGGITDNGTSIVLASDQVLMSAGDASLRVKNDGGPQLFITGLPTSDPSVEGQVWNDSGVLKISAG